MKKSTLKVFQKLTSGRCAHEIGGMVFATDGRRVLFLPAGEVKVPKPCSRGDDCEALAMIRETLDAMEADGPRLEVRVPDFVRVQRIAGYFGTRVFRLRADPSGRVHFVVDLHAEGGIFEGEEAEGDFYVSANYDIGYFKEALIEANGKATLRPVPWNGGAPTRKTPLCISTPDTMTWLMPIIFT